MSKNFVISMLVIFNLLLGFLAGAWSKTSDILLGINQTLIEELAKPHPIHDADLTIWRYDGGGDVTIMVNGMFPHVYERFCVRT